MSSVSDRQIPLNNFFSEVRVFNVTDGEIESTHEPSLDRLVRHAFEIQTPWVERDESSLPAEVAAAIVLPVFRSNSLVSLVVFLAKKSLPAGTEASELVGVLEYWCPVPPHDEVALSDGYYGKMERFANVSSFVRFEKGMGLPGQVWEKQTAVIHDDLANHPGFLRAAGASADLLQTAIGIPVFAADFVGSVVLISSLKTPICRGFQIWKACEEGFELIDATYNELHDSVCRGPGYKLPAEDGWARLITDSGGAVTSVDETLLTSGESVAESDTDTVPSCGLAIPNFVGESLDSFVTLLF